MQLFAQHSLKMAAREVFNWFFLPGSLERVAFPSKKVKLLSKEGNPEEEGFRYTFLIRIHFLWKRWILQRKTDLTSNKLVEEQLKGPFLKWRRTTAIKALTPTSCELLEEISYTLPFSFCKKKVKRELTHWCGWKSRLIEQDLLCYERYPKRSLRILVSGTSGLVGKSLVPFLQNAGHSVVCLVRRQGDLSEDVICWNPLTGDIDKEQFEGFDAVIHLAGDNVASGMWTKQKKERIFLSRCRDTWLLSHVLVRLYQPPKLVICASAVGYYGNRADELLTESSAKGQGFFSEVCARWEAATQVIENRGSRVVHTRFGPILAASGGVLGALLPLVRWNLGAVLGKGEQFMSWIAVDDVIGALYHVLNREEITGAVNVVAPHPVTQREFIRAVAQKMHRKVFVRIPERVLKISLKTMAEELLLSSQNVKPERLLQTGYAFRYPGLKEALDHLLS
jgi:uncharacterized protein